MYKIILLAITKHTELFLQWPCFKINFTQWYQHQNTSPTHIKSYWKRFRTILSQASIRELQSTKITGLLLKPKTLTNSSWGYLKEFMACCFDCCCKLLIFHWASKRLKAPPANWKNRWKYMYQLYPTVIQTTVYC